MNQKTIGDSLINIRIQLSTLKAHGIEPLTRVLPWARGCLLKDGWSELLLTKAIADKTPEQQWTIQRMRLSSKRIQQLEANLELWVKEVEGVSVERRRNQASGNS